MRTTEEILKERAPQCLGLLKSFIGPRNPVRLLLESHALLLEENARMKEALEWRTIESIPSDEWVLLWFADSHNSCHVSFGRFHGSHGWLESLEGCFFHVKPTHWQPLPQPPKEESKQ